MATVIATPQHNQPMPSNLGYNCIASHVFANPGTYDPTGGVAARHARAGQVVPAHFPQPKHETTRGSKEQPRKLNSESAPEERRDISVFTTALLNQINQYNAQPFSLPTTFMISFLQHCFHSDLTLVDFSQSLVGLEYLEELEKRRKRTVATGLSRLGIGRATLQSDADNLAKMHPSFAAWVKDVEPREKKAAALYTQLYVVLRRWILLNEFCLTPFHKYNCIAMLNVLLPPPTTASAKAPPAPSLTPAVLHEQREMYIKHINAIETRGIRVLNNLMYQGRREGEVTGWPSVRETLDKYLQMAEKLINEAESIDDFGAFDIPKQPSLVLDTTKRKTADSGVSFNSGNTSKKHSPTTSHAFNYAPGDTNKPLPSPPAEDPAVPTTTLKAASTLEKIAIELRKLKFRHKSADISYAPSSRPQNAQSTDAIPSASPPATNNTTATPNYSRLLGTNAAEQPEQSQGKTGVPASDERTGRKEEAGRSRGRSLSRNRSRSRSMSVGRLRFGKAEDEAEAFNRDEMLRQRAIWEARNSA